MNFLSLLVLYGGQSVFGIRRFYVQFGATVIGICIMLCHISHRLRCDNIPLCPSDVHCLRHHACITDGDRHGQRLGKQKLDTHTDNKS